MRFLGVAEWSNDRAMRVVYAALLLCLSSACKTISDDGQDSELEELRTAYPSTIPGLSLGGAHVVSRSGGEVKVIRGMAPSTDKEFEELIDYRITDVVIFKKQTRGEVDLEMATWKRFGLKADHIHSIPMAYKGFDGFEEPCRHTIEALRYIADARGRKNRKVLFHCTVGEDRTGMLAGLVRLLDTDDTVDKVFKTEMCDNGYSSGNPKKNRVVTASIDKDLTPVFIKLAYRIKKGQMSWDNLDADKICESSTLPRSHFEMDRTRAKPEDFRCR